MTSDPEPEDLDETLALLRGYVASFVVQAALETGLLELLDRRGASRAEIDARMGCDQRSTDALLLYLVTERIIELDGEVYRLTGRGGRFLRQRGWFRLLVGGYAGVLTRLPDLLTGRVEGDLRDLAAVAAGSGDIARFDAVPLAAGLVGATGRPCRRVLDVGCGDGQLLCGVLDHLPGATAVAVDPSADALATARRTIDRTPHVDRIELIHGDVVAATANLAAPDVVIAAFVLQELLGQSGYAAVVEFLCTLGQRWPSARWVVIEVDHRPDPELLGTPHGLGYYNGYYLLHPLTRQELLPRDRWSALFDEAGFVVERIAVADPAVDPTGLEVGFLLRVR